MRANLRHRLSIATLVCTLACLLGSLAMAQVVHLANHSSDRFGPAWVRTTVRAPRVAAGQVDDVLFVVGRRIGLDAQVVDLRVTLAPGERRDVDLGAANEVAFERGPMPANALEHFGGPLRVNGRDAQWRSLIADGAGYTVHLATRCSDVLLHADVWATWHPDQPGWCRGEVVVCASNPARADLFETARGGVMLTWGDAVVAPAGGLPFFVVPPVTTFADGQARVVPFHAVWLRHLAGNDGLSLRADDAVEAVGLERIYRGRVRHAPGQVGAMLKLAPEVTRRLHTWEPALFGAWKDPSVSGEQEDQLWHAEALEPGGVGCARVTLRSAFKAGGWPCHHLEVGGEQLDPARHQRLWFWRGRPNLRVGADHLGKGLAYDSGAPALNGWAPADPEHWLIGRVHEGAMLTGSPAAQWLLSMQAIVYPLQQSVDPAYTSGSIPFASRAVGLEGMNAARLYDGLEDRALAERIRVHWRARWERVLAPALTTVRYWPDGFEREGQWAPWQMALGALGVDDAGAAFGVPAARTAALQAALVVLEEGFYQGADGRWRTYKALPLTATSGPDADNTFWLFGYPCAVAVVLRHHPDNPRARAIWTQMEADAVRPSQVSWLAPDVR